MRRNNARRQSSATRRAEWMGKYEEWLVDAVPAERGRVDWDTAAFLYNEGYSPQAAALRTIERLTTG